MSVTKAMPIRRNSRALHGEQRGGSAAKARLRRAPWRRFSATAISTAWRAASVEQAVGEHRHDEVGPEQRAAGALASRCWSGKKAGSSEHTAAKGMASVCRPSRRA